MRASAALLLLLPCAVAGLRSREAEDAATQALARLEAALEKPWKEEKARYVVWRDGGPGAGWGNRFRGMTATMLLGLVTGRRFLIDHGDFFEAFMDPSSVGTLDYRAVAGDLQGLMEATLPYNSADFDRPLALLRQLQEQQQPQQKSRKHRGRAAPPPEVDVLVHQCGCSFEKQILSSPEDEVRKIALAIFGSLREDTFVEVAMRWLTKRPRPRLLENARRVVRSWKLQNYDGFAMVQDRQWTDVRKRDHSSKEAYTEKPHINCTRMRLEEYRKSLPGKQRLLIGVTSDSLKYTQMMMAAFEKVGDVRRNDMFTDNVISYETTHTPLTAREFVVDWMVLREAPFVVCTGSTYCISARASLGFGNNGSFPFSSERRSYRQGGPFCYGGSHEGEDVSNVDTITHPQDGRVFW